MQTVRVLGSCTVCTVYQCPHELIWGSNKKAAVQYATARKLLALNYGIASARMLRTAGL